MAKFDLEQNGYNRQQVDEYIANLSKRYEMKIIEQKDRMYGLKTELENTRITLETYQNKEKQISKALVYAVEKAEDIESVAEKQAEKLVHELKLLYVKWDNILSQVEVEYADSKKDKYLQNMIAELREGIDNILVNKSALEKTQVRTKLRDSGNDYVKNILNKMDYVVNSIEKAKKQDNETIHETLEKVVQEPVVKHYNEGNIEQKKKHSEVDMTKVMEQHKKENDRIGKIGGRLQSFMKLNGNKTFADSYLNSADEVEQSAYAKNFVKKNVAKDESPFNYAYPEPNESGFDLKEALNPKEDLDEIMKSFDFYKGDDNK